MNRTISTIVLMLMCLVSWAENDIKRVSITYDYVSNNPNESPEEAERMAFERARQKALEDNFGLDVSVANSTYLSNRASEGQSSGAIDFFSIRQSSVRGEWIETIDERIINKNFEAGFWHVKVRLEGKARCLASTPVDIRYAFVNNDHDQQNRDQYYDGDDVFLKFSSPVAGSLCVYLVDAEQNVFCLLPYMSTQSGCQSVKANTDYVFFSSKFDAVADEYTLNCEKSVEQNALYIIFTPNTLRKANDRKSGKNWRDEQMPRQLTFKDFSAWLANNQTRDKDLLVKTEIITIRK